MTDLDIIYEEVFGEEEDMQEFSMMMEKTKLFDKARTVYMYKGYAAVSCTKMLLKGIKKLRKKGFDSAKLDAYEKDLEEGKRLAKNLSMKLSTKCPIEWRMFPSNDVPPQFNILVLPYDVYAKERSAWARHM